MEAREESIRQDPPEDGKLTPGDLTESSRTVRRLDNFWYHYKWTVIIGAFFLLILIVGIVQIVSHVDYDLYITVAVPYTMNATEKDDLTELLQKICPRDFNEDGEVHVYIQTYQVYSEDEYASEQAYWEAQSERFQINSVYNQSQIKAFNSYIMNGQSTLLVLSPYMYAEKADADLLLPVADVYGSESHPAGVTKDGYGIRLSETDFYKYNPAAQVLPADTILCLHKPLWWGEKYDDSAAREMFRALVDWRVKE